MSFNPEVSMEQDPNAPSPITGGIVSNNVTTETVKVTADDNGNPTKVPVPKVVAATIGAGVGSAISTIGIYAFETATKIDLPDAVEISISVVIAAGITFLAGYFKRP